jgi:hypothetical protein
MNHEEEYFEEKHIEQSLERYQGNSAKEFNEKLVEEMEAFKGELPYPDDIAVLTCHFQL